MVIPTSPWTHYIIYIHHKVTHLHFNPHLISSNIPIIFNDTYTPNLTSTIILTNTITSIGNIYYIPHIHQKTPKIKIIKYYTWVNSTLLLQHGDVEPHPGPTSKILKTVPQEYTCYLKWLVYVLCYIFFIYFYNKELALIFLFHTLSPTTFKTSTNNQAFIFTPKESYTNLYIPTTTHTLSPKKLKNT